MRVEFTTGGAVSQVQEVRKRMPGRSGVGALNRESQSTMTPGFFV